MFRAIVLLGVSLTWLVLAGSSRAGIILEFAVGGTPTTAIEIPSPGATVPIQVYLTQTGPLGVGEPDLSSDLLWTAGIEVSFDSPPGIAAVSLAGDIQQNAAFDDAVVLYKAVTATTAQLNEAVDIFASPPSPLLAPDGTGRILLGTFTLTGLTPGTTTISVSDLTAGDDFLTGLGDALDGFITSGPASLTVNPEPGSLVLSMLVFGAASAATRYRNRRRRKQSHANEGHAGAIITS